MNDENEPAQNDAVSRGRERLSPSSFMRGLRPELYSDSTDKASYRLERSLLEYQLDSITSRNQTQDFEIFCRKLCERAICPNLRPQTGPEGGGDSKADTETYPVSDEVSALFIGEPNAGRERWAFAFSAKARWQQKIRDDVKGIVETNRRYDKIICVTSRPARAKDRAALEDALSKQYNIPVTIHDRTWIVKEVIEHDRKDIAFNYLGVGEANNDPLSLGPVDYSRVRQLREIEATLDDQKAFEGIEGQRVTEALIAAKLSRNLERPRVETDGRFQRAIRLAKADGTFRQVLETRYEHIWTAYWWFDDITFLLENYDEFEIDALKSDHTNNLQFLCNLFQLLVNCVVHGLLTREQTQIDKRAKRIQLALEPMASNNERPNNALEAEALLVAGRLNWAILERDSGALAAVWHDFGQILDKAEGLGEFDAGRVEKMIEVGGQIAGNDPNYTQLVERLAEFVSKRRSEGEGAIILLKRAQKIDFDHHLDIIRLLGKAAIRLNKKEYAEHLIQAVYLLSVAYKSAGLYWAARSSCIFAAASIAIDSEGEAQMPPSIVSAMRLWAWLALSLGHVPDFLFAIQLLNGASESLALTLDSKQLVQSDLRELDMALGSFLLNLNHADLDQLDGIPDILDGLGLFSARTALLYVNGHLATMREEGSLPASVRDDEVHELMSRLASQPVGREHSGFLVLNQQGVQTLRTTVMGMVIELTHSGTDHSIILAETILGALEAFFGTALEQRMSPHTERVYLVLEECAELEEPAVETSALDYRAIMKWPSSVSPTSFQQQRIVHAFIAEVAARVFALTCFSFNSEEFIQQLFETDAVQQRMVMVTSTANSYHRISLRSLSRISDWDAHVKTRYPTIKPRPQILLKDLGESEEGASDSEKETFNEGPPKIKSHRDITVKSIIDTHAWDQALWRGVGYGGYGPHYPPFMMLLFKNRNAAIKIFQRWRERFGDRDTNSQIHVAIVRKLPNSNPHHYCVLISAKPPSNYDASLGKFFLIAARINRMEPDTDLNLQRFLDDYKHYRCFFLVPAAIAKDGNPEPIAELAILKRDLVVKEAAEVGEHDLEAMALKAH